MDTADLSYDATLAQLHRQLPRLATTLRRAERQRCERAAALLGGARFAGVDQLLRWLDELGEAFSVHPALAPLAFLVHRVSSDLDTAVEATLSGYLGVAADAMRDVMEIEDLFLDFAVHPTHVSEWLAADRAALVGKFAPGTVRARLHRAGEVKYADTAVSIDYRAHSASLHVGPAPELIAARGCSPEQGWVGDAGFWEVFEHMRRLQRAVPRLTASLAPHSRADELARTTLTHTVDAWERTQQMQTIYLALLEAIARSRSAADDQIP